MYCLDLFGIFFKICFYFLYIQNIDCKLPTIFLQFQIIKYKKLCEKYEKKEPYLLIY